MRLWMAGTLWLSALVATAPRPAAGQAPRPKRPSVLAAATKTARARVNLAELRARGDAWAVAGRCDEAIQSYRHVLQLVPSDTVVAVRLAHCLAQSGGGEEARTMLTALTTAAPPTGTRALQELGDLALQARAFAAAAAAYDQLLTELPGDLDARAGLVDALAGLSDAGDEAARSRGQALARALAVDRRADPALQRHAEELAGAFQFGDAARDVAEGRRKLAMGDAKAAVAALERAVAKHADLEAAQYLLGVAYTNPEIARRDEGRKAWRRAPHVKEAQLALGVDAYEAGDLPVAVERLRAALALDGGYQAALYQLGLVYKEEGETQSARDAWQKAARLAPDSELGRWAATKLQVLTGNVSALAEGQVIDPSSEIGIGQELSRQVIDHWGTFSDAALQDRLDGILRRLSHVADRPERELRYRVVLVDVPMVNALTLPGGTILVFRGLVDLVKKQLGDSDDAYAAVLGHECAHAALRHGLGMIQMASSMGPPGQALVSDERQLFSLINTISRAHEFEADQFGALYAYRAGFDPAWAVTLHEKMLRSMGEIPRGMTHPTHAERIARVRDYLLDLRAKVRGFDLAVKALDGGDYETAANRFEVFLGVFPDSLSARSNLGVALHRRALLALAPATRFRRSTDVDPDARAHKIELRAGETNVGGLKAAPVVDEHLLREAKGEYEAALALDPGYAIAAINLGAAQDDLKDRRGARATLEKAVRLAPAAKQAWNNLAAVAAESGDTARALDALGRAVALDGGYAEAWFNFGLVYEQAGRTKDAAAAWDRYGSIDPKSGWSAVAREHRARLP